MPNTQLYTFGSPRILVSGKRIDPGRRKSLGLFVYLSITQRYHSRESLMALFFPDDDHDHARASLRRILASLKAVLPVDWLEGDRERIGIRSTPELWVDIQRFHLLIAQARAHTHESDGACETCLQALSEAVHLAADDFLSGFNLPNCPEFDAWAHHQRELLRQTVSGVLDRLVRGHSAQGNFDVAIAAALRQVQLDPLHEAAYRHLMRLYEWSGRRTDALRQFALCQQALGQIGAQPEAETRHLLETIQQGTLAAWQRDATTAAPPVHIGRIDHLSAQPPFIGRAAELRALQQHLADPAVRLITLVGPGGMGKTRLALRVGELVQDQFRHGAVFVPLAAVQGAEALVSTIAQAVGFTLVDPGSLKARLLRYLSDKELLLILDNVNHLLDEAPLLADLLAYARGLRVICTSRELLRVDGERAYPILEMAYPHANSTASAETYDAVQMFLQSAQRVQPDFDPALHLATVVRICQLVQGMPLALDLAAGWLPVLSAEQIADRLAVGFDLLTSQRRDGPLRQRDMRSVIGESWAMLTEREQSLLMRLSLFRGGFSVDVLERIVSDALPDLASLMYKAMIRREPDARYSLHELLRQYAAERLTDSSAFARTAAGEFSAYYARWMCQQAPLLHSRDQRRALTALDSEIDNVLVAWHWAAENACADLLDAMRIALDRYSEARGRLRERTEALRLAVEHLEQHAEDEAIRPTLEALRAQWGRALLGTPERSVGYAALRASLDYFDSRGAACESAYAELALAHGMVLYDRQYADAEVILQHILPRLSGLDEAVGGELRSEALFQLGRLASYTGQFVQSRAYYEDSLALAQRLGNPITIAEVLSGLGVLALIREQFDEAKSWLEEALVVNQRCDHKIRTARDLQRLAVVAMRQGDQAAAQDYYQRCLVLSHDLGDYKAECAVLIGLGVSAYYQKDHETALSRYREALAAARELGDQEAVANCLSNIAIIYWEQGRSLPEAKRLTQESLSIHRANGVPSLVATTLQSLGVITYTCGEVEEACDYLLEALRISVEIDLKDQLLNACSWLPFCLVQRGEVRTAYALYLVLLDYPAFTLDVPIWRQEVEPFLTRIPPDVRSAVEATREGVTLEDVIASLCNPCPRG